MQQESLLSGIFYTEIFGFIIALMLCALFSFLETTITALRLFKLKELADKSTQYKSLIKELENSPHNVLITMVIANSLANVTAAALITHIMEEIFSRLHLSSGLGFSLGIGIATTAILIFGEVIPKNIAKVHGEKLLPHILGITNFIFYLLYPFVTLLVRLANFFVGYVGETGEVVVSEREIQFLIDYINEKGLIEKDKTEMLQSIFKLGSTHVKEILVPEIDVVMLDVATPLEDALKIFANYQYTRFPVYQDARNNVIGIVHLKDLFILLSQNRFNSLKELIRPVLFIPESMKINQLLREFRQQHMHMAMVLNEYGSIIGIATLEDVLEEIVGEIRDEYESVTEKVIALEKGGWVIDATIDLDSLEKMLGVEFKTHDAVTLGGFLTAQLQHVPQVGESLIYKGYLFHVQQASIKRVVQVHVTKEAKQATGLP